MHAIVLAHEKSFGIGPVAFHPSTRSVNRGSRREILEPRVMQVLVALWRTPGEVVSRDDLVEACWNGRVVGDDAVNRVIARLRRTAEGIGDGVFTIDTITRVGYRLRLLDVSAVRTSDDAQPNPAERRLSRRAAIAGGAAAAAAAVTIGGGSLLLGRRDIGPRLSPESIALLQQAKIAQWQNTPEGQNQAIGLYRQVATTNPDYADGWGRLSTAYAWTAHYRQNTEALVLRDRAHAAGQRALDLDPRNAFARIGLATALPFVGNWLPIDRALREAAALQPRQDEISFNLALFLGCAGRASEALKYMNLVLPSGPTPAVYFYQSQMLWAAGRNEELDALLEEARRIYPTHFALWFSRFYTAMLSGRPGQALALAADVPNRPTNIDAEEVEAVVRVARAIESPSPASVDAVTSEWLDRAHRGAGYAENAIQFMSALGRIDEAFSVLRAYYFSEGFDCGEVRFTSIQGTYTPHNDRLTAFLFNPALAPVRTDRRFARLMNDLQFVDYWQSSGNPPDYLRSHA